MADNKQINWILTANDRATPVFRGLESVMGRLESAGSKLMTALGAGAGGGSFAEFWHKATVAQMEAEVATNRLNAVLTATGGIAGHTLQQISDYADELAQLTQFDDESFRNAAGTLAKFGDIHGQVFHEALKLSADYAAVVGTDVPSAAQALGKALQSPTEGLRTIEKEFGKLGVMQKENIREMVESGRLAEAQGAILDVLKGKIGGAAEAMNTGLNKATHDLTKSWNEMLEAFGKTDLVNTTTQGGLMSLSRMLDGIKATVEYLSSAVPGLGGMPRDRLPPKGLQGDVGTINMGGMPQIRLATEEELKQRADAAREAAKKAAEELIRRNEALMKEGTAGWVKYADFVFQTAEDLDNALAKINQEAIDEEQKLLKKGIEGWVAYAEAKYDQWDREQTELGRIADEREKEAKKADSYMKDLGVTFSSAFEDAVVKGNGLRSVLQGLGQDILRIMTRKLVSDPLGNFATDAIKSVNWGGMFGGGGGYKATSLDWAEPRASGGPVMGGGSYLVGEQGPELFTPAGSGTITPNSGTNITIHYAASGNGAADAQQMAATLVPLIKSVVRGEITTQLRPGGALA